MKSKSVIHRKGFGLKDQVMPELERDFHSTLISYLLSHDYEMHIDDLHVYLVKRFGTCYGVDRAIEYAYETVARFPNRKKYLLGEIVHNPAVNKKLREMGIEILNGLEQENMDFAFIRPEDVVILPAFGVTNTALQNLKKQHCTIVDTTCGSVLSVWKRAEKHAQNGYTVLIHGKYHHEETTALRSQISQYPNAKYLVIRNRSDAQFVCDVITGDISSSAFMKRLGQFASDHFNPDTDLQQIGFVNQTTMLASESAEIARMINTALRQRYGESESNDRFRNLDTICYETQDRQDALLDLIRQKQPDILLIIGGYNSSNTKSLASIASSNASTYHIQGAGSLISINEIEHQQTSDHEIVVSRDWLLSDEVHIGVTAGASTPAREIGKVLERLLALNGISAESMQQIIS